MAVSAAARLALLAAAAAALRHATAVRDSFDAETVLAASNEPNGGDDPEDDGDAIVLRYDKDSEDEDSEPEGTAAFPRYKEKDIVKVKLHKGTNIAVICTISDVDELAGGDQFVRLQYRSGYHGPMTQRASNTDEIQPADDQEREKLGDRTTWDAIWREGNVAWAHPPEGDRFTSGEWTFVEVVEGPAKGSEDVIVDFGKEGFNAWKLSIFDLRRQKPTS